MNDSLRQYREMLGRYLRPQWHKVVLLALLLFVVAALQLINPRIIGNFIDMARAGSPMDALLGAGILFLVIVFTEKIVMGAMVYFSEDVGWTATNALRLDLASHCLNLDPSFHQMHTPGELIERIDGDVNALANFFSTFVLNILGSVIVFGGALILIWQMDWRMGLSLILYSVLSVVMFVTLHNKGVPHFAALRQTSADLSGFWAERLGGREDIRAAGAEDHAMGRLYQLLRTRWRKALRSQFMSGLLINSWFIVYALNYGTIMALGAYLVGVDILTIGSLFVIFRYSGFLTDNLRALAYEMDDLQRATASLQRIRNLYYTTSQVMDGKGDALPAGALDIAFEDVAFAYVEDVPVLHGLSFHLPPGTVLGLLGRTGSGKTTITRLLFRFYDPTGGTIRLNGADLRDLYLHDLRRRIGIVTQDVQLFQATVRDNLTFFDPNVSDEHILEALEALGLQPWLLSLPKGLDTVLEAGSGALSAGEAQLLALTRVFLEDPDLVILDEASSRLDPSTERLLELAMDRLLADRTAIIIAHRLATVHRADEVMILENGHIVEHGQRARLMQDASSRFAHLLRTGMEEILA